MNDLMRRLLFLPEQASTVAAAIDALHFTVIVATMLGAAAVGLTALWFAVRYRRRPGDVAVAAGHGARRLEWVGIGVLFTLFVGWWWIGYRQYLALQAPPPGALVIEVVAKQWMWKFGYPGGQHSIAMLVVPAGRPVELVMRSRDVIHGFFVPAFRIKRDVVPGAISVAWFQTVGAGTWPILCTQYCGTSHSKMRGEVVALREDQYAAWLAGTGSGLDDATAAEAAERRAMAPDAADGPGVWREAPPEVRGREAAARHGCLSCHTEDGQRHIGPTWRGLFASRVALEDGRTVVADEEYLTRSMMDPGTDVVAGYQALMPSYRGLLDPDDAAAIVAYIRALAAPAAPPPERNPPLPPQAEPGRAP